MGKLVNLRTVKKQRSRDQARVDADKATAVTHVKKSERKRTAQINTLANRTLDGHKRDGDT